MTEARVDRYFKFCTSHLTKWPNLHYLLCIIYGFWMALLVYLPTMIYKFGFRRLFLKKRPERSRPSFNLKEEGFKEHGFMTSDGTDLHFVTRGDPKGQVLLFLHGFPDCWRTWKNQVEFFSPDSESKLCSVLLSLRGYGKSGKPRGRHEYHALRIAKDIKEVIEYLEKDQVILIGHDWGGLIAWTVAMKYPIFVEKLIVLNAPPLQLFQNSLNSNYRQFLASWYVFFFQIPSIPEVCIKLGDFAFLDNVYRGLIASGRITDEDLNTLKYYLGQPESLTGMVNYYRNLFSVGNLGKVRSPTLVIWGEDDPFLLKESLLGLDKLIDVEFQVRYFSSLGHWIHLEAPDLVNENILRFVMR